MKIAASDIKDTLSVVNRWIPPKPIVEASGGFLFTWIDEGTISVSATDMVVSDIVMTLDVYENTEFDPFVVNAKRLISIISSMSKIGQDIYIELSGSHIVIKCGHHTATIITTIGEEFPYIRKIPDVKGFDVNQHELFTAISGAKDAAIPDNPRRSLAGIYFSHGDVVSADGFRMIVISDVWLTEEPVIVPAEFCNKLGYVLWSMDGDVTVYHEKDSGHLFIKWNRGTMSTSLIALDFPNYKMMIPESYSTEVIVPKKDLAIALDLASPFSEEASNLVIMTFVDGTILIEAASGTGSNSSTIDTVLFNGEEIKIGISCKFLKHAVSYLQDEVAIMMNGPEGIVMISDGENLMYGIMPMAVS